jgi:hypothetical protein
MTTLVGMEESRVSKKAIWLGMIVGSTLGGWIPALWHASMFSLWSVVLSTAGGIAGIWVAFRLTR